MITIDPIEGITLLSLLVLIVMMFAIWVELRRLRELVRTFLLTTRENSRSIMAAIHELGALSYRARRADVKRGSRVSEELD